MQHHDHRFRMRFVQLNAPLLSAWLRHIADQVDAIAPGPPLAAAIWFLQDKEFPVSEITVRDDSAPLGATVTFVDAKGAATEPDDTPAWASSDESVATVEASADGKSATVTIGLPGASVITVTSTDLDGTVVTSMGSVFVTAGEAVLGDVEFTAAA